MNIFFIVVYFSFVLWLIRNVLFWVGLWQDKEYRLDRLWVHFRETVQGRHIFFSYGNSIKWLFLFLFGFVTFYDTFTNIYDIGLGMFFIIQGVCILQDVITHHIKRPVFTSKAVVLTVLSLSSLGVLLLFPLLGDMFVWLLIIDRLLPVVVTVFVFFFAFPTEIFEDIKINKAKKKMKKLGNILVIAVSGSYGKTSTKEYIAQVLSKKFRVVKTAGSHNTPVGIANTILSKITTDTEIFVVEMGAYKKGEIADLTQIVRPKISVTTAISDQHISLYGSLENIIDSEYELIHSLPKDGLALFNGNSKHMQALYNRTKRKKILYQWFTKKQNTSYHIAAYNVFPTLDGISFTAILDNEEFFCKAPLYGMHVVENILPAIYVAHYLGFTKEEITHALSDLQSPAQTMIKRLLRNSAIAMDDSFNASPESVIAAMDFLQLSDKKKFFVLAPLTELGKEAKEHHYQIGRKASETCDYLFLLNKNFSQQIFKGVIDGKGTCHVQIARPEHIAKSLERLSKKGDMIIFEGKETKMVLKKLL
jgi:UDP-N-acetylmuramoyl-tripeptide--D-alanyl-D-alanine ligase